MADSLYYNAATNTYNTTQQNQANQDGQNVGYGTQTPILGAPPGSTKTTTYGASGIGKENVYITPAQGAQGAKPPAQKPSVVTQVPAGVHEFGVQHLSPQQMNEQEYQQNQDTYNAMAQGKLGSETISYIATVYGLAPSASPEYIRIAQEVQRNMGLSPERIAEIGKEAQGIELKEQVLRRTGVSPANINTVWYSEQTGKATAYESGGQKIILEPAVPAPKAVPSNPPGSTNIPLNEGSDISPSWIEAKGELIGNRITTGTVMAGLGGFVQEKTYLVGKDTYVISSPVFSPSIEKDLPAQVKTQSIIKYFFPGQKEFGGGMGYGIEQSYQKRISENLRTAVIDNYKNTEYENMAMSALAAAGQPTPGPSKPEFLKNTYAGFGVSAVGEFYHRVGQGGAFIADFPIEVLRVATGQHEPIPFEEAGGAWKVLPQAGGLLLTGAVEDVTGALQLKPESIGGLVFDVQLGKMFVEGGAKVSPIRYGSVDVKVPIENEPLSPKASGLGSMNAISRAISYSREGAKEGVSTTIYRGIFAQTVEEPSVPLGIRESTAKPLIGLVEGGKLKIGAPAPSEMPSFSKTIFPEQGVKNVVSYPETALDVSVKGTPKALEAQGFTIENISAKTEFVKYSNRNIMLERSMFDTSIYPTETKVLDARATEIALNVAKAQNTPFSNVMNFLTGGEYRKTEVYGSFAEMEQRSEGLKRTPGDIEIAKEGRSGAIKQATETASALKRAGYKTEVTEEPVVILNVGGEKAIEFRYPGDEPGMEGKGYRYGFSENRPRTSVEGLNRQAIGEQMIRKGGASALLQTTSIRQLEEIGVIKRSGGGKIIEPAGHRPKDVADFYAENLNAIKEREARRLNTPAQISEMKTRTQAFRDANWRNPEIKEKLLEVDTNLDAYLKEMAEEPKPRQPINFEETQSVSRSLRESKLKSISASISASASVSPSVSPSLSPSKSLSVFPSKSLSVFPSKSLSVFPSTSSSSSISISNSSSTSVSRSRSISPSRSVSTSPSVSMSPSLSVSISESLSTSPSVSRSVSPSVGKTGYSSFGGRSSLLGGVNRKKKGKKKKKSKKTMLRSLFTDYTPTISPVEKTQIEFKTRQPAGIYRVPTKRNKSLFEKNLGTIGGATGLTSGLVRRARGLKLPHVRNSGGVWGNGSFNLKGISANPFKGLGRKNKKRR